MDYIRFPYTLTGPGGSGTEVDGIRYVQDQDFTYTMNLDVSPPYSCKDKIFIAIDIE